MRTNRDYVPLILRKKKKKNKGTVQAGNECPAPKSRWSLSDLQKVRQRIAETILKVRKITEAAAIKRKKMGNIRALAGKTITSNSGRVTDLAVYVDLNGSHMKGRQKRGLRSLRLLREFRGLDQRAKR